MTASLRVPDSRVQSFDLLSEMTEEAFKELFMETAKNGNVVYSDEVIHQLSSRVKLTSKKDIFNVFKTILSLFTPIVTSGKSVSEFVEDLILALKRKVDEPRDDKKIDILRVRLNQMLKIPTLSVMAKAANVTYDNEKSYISSRVISEIRPVFGLEDDSINGVVLTHTLKLEYEEGYGERNVLYVALDSKDLEELIAKLEREKNKSSKIQGLLEKGSINLIEIENK